MLRACAAALLGLTACTGDWLPGGDPCVPGEERSCWCHGGDESLQVCADHGRNWQRCRCDTEGAAEGEGEGEGAAEGEGEGAAEGEGEGAAEGEGEGAAEGEGETGLTLAALAGVWQLRATDGEGAAAVKGSFELGADGSLVGGRIYVLMLDNPAGERFSLDLGEDGGVRIDDAVARTVTVNLVTAVVTAVGVVDGPASSISGTFDSAMAESGRFDAWRFPVSAGGWRCHPEFRAAADGCDCSCGRDDPDCGEGPCGYCYGEDGSSVDCDE